MTQDVLIEALRHMMWLSLILSLPVLGVALVVGVAVGLVQAVTSIQEQTLSFVPKVIATVAVLALLGAWMTRMLVAYSGELFANLPRFGAL
jgi:flagellar biosynthetic protein FliQ